MAKKILMELSQSKCWGTKMKKELEKIKAVWKAVFKSRSQVIAEGDTIVINGQYTLDNTGDNSWNVTAWQDSEHPEDTGEYTIATDKTFDNALRELITALVNNEMENTLSDINLAYDLAETEKLVEGEIF